MAFSAPLIPVSSVDALAEKSLPSTHSFCSLDADNLVVSAVKKAEREEAIVLRVFEMEGAKAQTPIEFLGRRHGFRAVNLIEEGDRSSDQETLRVDPYEISTVRLVPK
jgi:alpha-mannosidase